MSTIEEIQHLENTIDEKYKIHSEELVKQEHKIFLWWLYVIMSTLILLIKGFSK